VSATRPAGVSLDGHTLYVDPSDPAYDHLAVGQSTSIVVSYDVTDAQGAKTAQTETITVHGTYDPPVTTTSHGGDRDGQTHLPPVIDTTNFHIVQGADGTMTISGLQVTDADPQAASKAFTLSASALHGSIASPSNDSTDLQHINSDLHAVIYVPGSTHPQSDDITLTVTDSFGGSDTVHFIFNESGPPGNSNKVTLTGAGGKDVIIATGYNDTLEGGAGADQFVFAPNSSTNQDTITSFKPGEDHIDVRAFLTVDSANIGQWLSVHATRQGSTDTLLKLDDHDSIVLKGIQVSSLHTSDFIVSPHG